MDVDEEIFDPIYDADMTCHFCGAIYNGGIRCESCGYGDPMDTGEFDPATGEEI